MVIQREGLHVYAMCECQENSYFLSTEYPMIRHNGLSSLLSVEVKEQDGKRSLYYDITGSCSLEQWGENHEAGYHQCSMVVEGIIRLFQELEEYMLSLDQIRFKKDSIFMDTEGRIKWIYGPDKSQDVLEDMRELFSWILSIVDYKDRKGMELIYKVFHGIKKKEFSKAFLEACIDAQEAPQYGQQRMQESYNSTMVDYADAVKSLPVRRPYVQEKEVRQESLLEDQRKGHTQVETTNRSVHSSHRIKIAIMGIAAGLDLLSTGSLIYMIYLRGITLRAGIVAAIGILAFALLMYLIIMDIIDYKNEVKSGGESGSPMQQAADFAQEVQRLQEDWPFTDEEVLRSKRQSTMGSMPMGSMTRGSMPMESMNMRPMNMQSVMKEEAEEDIFQKLEEQWGKQESRIIYSDAAGRVIPMLYAEHSDEVVTLQVSPFYIGHRNGLNQLSLQDNSVSLQHAVITKGEDNQYYIRDLGSQYGTKVDGRILIGDTPTMLRQGSSILFGQVAWKFCFSESL